MCAGNEGKKAKSKKNDQNPTKNEKTSSRDQNRSRIKAEKVQKSINQVQMQS